MLLEDRDSKRKVDFDDPLDKVFMGMFRLAIVGDGVFQRLSGHVDESVVDMLISGRGILLSCVGQ